MEAVTGSPAAPEVLVPPVEAALQDATRVCSFKTAPPHLRCLVKTAEMEPWNAERAAALAASFAAAAALEASSERGDPLPPRSSRSLNRPMDTCLSLLAHLWGTCWFAWQATNRCSLVRGKWYRGISDDGRLGQLA